MAKRLTRDRELEEKSRRCCDGINKTIHLIANEPSMGLYRIQQHIHKALPKCVECQRSVSSDSARLKTLAFDVTEATSVLQSIEKTQETFNSIESTLRKAVTSAAMINMNHKLITKQS
uniref:Protein MEF2BNB homolog n=1 Tax=Phallusia mammillata TaxID=59560 RepID=A0A6F9D762_9ASCI|nr:protein MEF2BNB homolog [Phallusia mammillata]